MINRRNMFQRSLLGGLTLAASALAAPLQAKVTNQSVGAGKVLQLESFGVTGRTSGEANAQAMQTALDELMDAKSGGVLELPPYKVVLANKVVRDVTGKVLVIRGYGAMASILEIDGQSTGDGLLFESRNREHYYRFENFQVTPVGAIPGTGLKAVGLTGGNKHNSNLECIGMQFGSGDAQTGDYFGTVMDFSGSWRPNVTNNKSTGPFGPDVDDSFGDNSPTRLSTVVLRIDNCFAPRVVFNDFWGAQIGVSDVGENQEGGYVAYNRFVEVGIGYDRRRKDREPNFWFGFNHTNYRDVGLRVSGAQNIFLNSNNFYQRDKTEAAAEAPRDISLSNVEGVIGTGNNGHFKGDSRRVHLFLDGSTVLRDVDYRQYSLTGTYQSGVETTGASADVMLSPAFATGKIAEQTTGGNPTLIADPAGAPVVAANGATWQPVLTFDGNTSGAQFVANGTYSITGNVMSFEIDLTVMALNIGSGVAEISLPPKPSGGRIVQDGKGVANCQFAEAMKNLGGISGRTTANNTIRLLNWTPSGTVDLTAANFTRSSALKLFGQAFLQ